MKDWNIKEEKAQNAIYLKEDNGGKGRFFRARFLQAGLVKYSFGVCLLKKETIDKFVYGFVGCPVVIDHKDVSDKNAKDLRVGVISKVEFEQFDGWYWCEGVIFDQEAIDLVNNGYNVSCQYEITQYATNDRKELHNGNEYDKEILDGAPEHLAIVKNPRYESAMIAVNAIDLTAVNDKWITVHPNGEDEEGRPLLIKEGEDVKDAMKRQWGAGDDQLTLDLPGAKEAKKDARTHENKKQAAKEKLFNAWSSHLWESDTKQASKKTMEALEEYNKYHEEKIDMDDLDDFVERYEEEKDNEKNKAQVDEYNKKNKEKEDAKKKATKLKDNESKEDFVKRILSTEITKYKPTTDVIDWGKQKQQGKRSGGMVMGSMGDISLQGKKEYKNILGGLPEYQEIKDEFNGGGVETPMMQMAYLKAREAGFDKEQSMLFAYSITDKNNLLYDKLKEGNKNKASNSFIDQFKDTLYTVLAEGITNRLGELIASNEERWITVHPHGDDSEDYRRLKLEDGETPKQAIDRVFKKEDKSNNDKEKSEKELKEEKKQLYQDILIAKKKGDKETHHKLLERYKEIERILKGEKEPEKKDEKEENNNDKIKNQIDSLKKEIAQIDDENEKITKENQVHERALAKFWDETDSREEAQAKVNQYFEDHKEELTKAATRLKELEEQRINKQKELDKILSDRADELAYKDLLKLDEKDLDSLQKDIEELLKQSLPYHSRSDLERALRKIKEQKSGLSYKKNRKEVTEIAHVKKGKEMTHEQADSGNVNPEYRKEPGYTTNCQTCVVVYEARLRGFDVKSLGNHKNETIRNLSHRTNLAWIDPNTGLKPEYIIDTNVKNSKSCYDWLEKELKAGYRYTLQWSWKGRSRNGHIVSISKDKNNNISIYDPQTNQTKTGKNELTNYFKEFKYQMSVYGTKIAHPPKLLRVDNLDFDTEIVNKIMTKGN